MNTDLGWAHKPAQIPHSILRHGHAFFPKTVDLPSFPLDRAGGLAGHVVDDPVDALDLVDDGIGGSVARSSSCHSTYNKLPGYSP